MKMFLLAAGVALAASAAPAFAQDADTGPAMSASSDGASFTGPRGEIFGGWDRVGSRARFNNGAGIDTVSHSHDSAWTAGGLLGYDMPVGDRLTVGILGSYALSTAKACEGPAGPGAFGGCLKSGRQIEGGARVGYKVTPRTLLYVKGAYVNGQVKAKFGNGTEYAGGRADRDGARAGAGAEFALNKHAYVKAEYDYTRFRKFDADDLGVTDTSLRYDRNQVLAGFGVHF